MSVSFKNSNILSDLDISIQKNKKKTIHKQLPSLNLNKVINESTLFNDSLLTIKSKLKNDSSHIQQKYGKLLDPSFLRDDDILDNKNIKSPSFWNYSESNIPTKLMNIINFKPYEKKNIKNDLKIENQNQNNNPLANKQMFEQRKLVDLRINKEKLKKKINIQKSTDISYLNEIPQNLKNSSMQLKNTNDSYIKKDYYRDNNGNSLNEIPHRDLKSNIYLQIFDHNHSTNLLETNISSIKDKINNDNENNNSKINNTKILDLVHVLNEETISKVSSKILLNHKSQSSNSLINKTSIKNRYPTQKIEVKSLEDWLNLMLYQLSSAKNTSSPKEILFNSQLIYTTCLKELIRQVSLQCTERGNLIQRIWQDYLKIVENAILTEKTSSNSIEIQQVNEISRVHKIYEQEIKFITEQYNKSIKEMKELQKVKEKLFQEKTYMIKLNKKIINRISELENNLIEARKEIDKLLIENYNLKLSGDESSHLKINRKKEKKSTIGSPRLPVSDQYNYNSPNNNENEGIIVTENKKIQINTNKTSVVNHLIELKNRGENNASSEINEEKNKITEKLNSEMNFIKKNEVSFITEVEGENYENIIILKEIYTDTIDLINKEDKNIETDNFDKNDKNYNDNNINLIRNIIKSIDFENDSKEKIVFEFNKIINLIKDFSVSEQKDFFIDSQINLLKENNLKMKIELSELNIENDTMKDKIKNQENLMVNYVGKIEKLRMENKIFKKNTAEFQKILENFSDLISGESTNKELLNNDFIFFIQSSTREMIQKNQLIIKENGNNKDDIFNFNLKESDSENEDDSPNSPKKLIKYMKESVSVYKNSLKRVFSVNTDSANVLLTQIISKNNEDLIKKEPSKINIINENLLLKFITKIYREKCIQDKNSIHIPLHVVCYDFLLNRYGLKKEADKKLDQIFQSCLHYQYKNHRISIFTKLLGLNGEKDSDDLNYYINSMKFCNEKDNITIDQNFHDKVFISFDTALKLISHLFENRIDEKSYNNLLIYSNEFKITQEKTNIIEFDLLMLKILDIYEIQKNEMKSHLQFLFYAADLDHDQYIELYEFLLIYRHIEKNSFSLEKVKRLFVEESDTIVPITGERAISFVKFINLAIEFNLFSEKETKKFELAQINDPIQNINDLIKKCDEIIEELKLRFIKAKCFNALFKKIMMHLEEKIKNNEDIINPKILWLSYRLLEEESKRVVLDHLSNELLPGEFKIITDDYADLNQIEMELI